MDLDDFNRLLQVLCDLDGSDLHIKAGSAPRVRVDGHLRMLDDEPRINAEETAALAEGIMLPNIREIFAEKHEADFAYSVNGVGRFRINAFYQRGSVALAVRRVRTSASSHRGARPSRRGAGAWPRSSAAWCSSPVRRDRARPPRWRR